MHTKRIRTACVLASAMALSLGSCVDDSYDLSDVDMEMTFMEESLSLPASSLQAITLDQILDLDNQSSIIRVSDEDKANNPALASFATGDYILYQEGQSNDIVYHIAEVNIPDPKPDYKFYKIPVFPNPGINIPNVPIPEIVNNIALQATDIDPQIVSVNWVKTDVIIGLDIAISGNYDGSLVINKGFTITFPESFTLTANPASATDVSVKDGHIVEFNNDVNLINGTPLHISAHLVEIDLDKLPAGQGLHNGQFNVDIDLVSKGSITIGKSSAPLGEMVDLTFDFTVSVSSAKIKAVRGIVDPKIDVPSVDFSLNDIPDYLKTSDNRLDIENPRVIFTINNGSPLHIEFGGKLEAFKDGRPVEDAVASINGLRVEPDKSTAFTISRVRIDGVPNNVDVPALGNVMRTIPDRISFTDIYCKTLPEPATIQLNSDLNFKGEYKALVPLSFGPDMHLVYTHEVRDWDQDLTKYNARTVEIKADIVNGLPMALDPTVTATGKGGAERTDLRCVITNQKGEHAVIAPCTKDGATTTPVVITITSDGANLGYIDGINLDFTGFTNEDCAGINLNANQTVHFDNIIVSIKGGISVDLN